MHTSDQMIQVFPYADSGNLSEFIYNDNAMSEEAILEYFRQICYGTMILHQNKIIHRDIKPDNILVQKFQ